MVSVPVMVAGACPEGDSLQVLFAFVSPLYYYEDAGRTGRLNLPFQVLTVGRAQLLR